MAKVYHQTDHQLTILAHDNIQKILECYCPKCQQDIFLFLGTEKEFITLVFLGHV
jgi:hypothetical protein